MRSRDRRARERTCGRRRQVSYEAATARPRRAADERKADLHEQPSHSRGRARGATDGAGAVPRARVHRQAARLPREERRRPAQSGSRWNATACASSSCLQQAALGDGPRRPRRTKARACIGYPDLCSWLCTHQHRFRCDEGRSAYRLNRPSLSRARACTCEHHRFSRLVVRGSPIGLSGVEAKKIQDSAHAKLVTSGLRGHQSNLPKPQNYQPLRSSAQGCVAVAVSRKQTRFRDD